jgi:hypothetical protein
MDAGSTQTPTSVATGALALVSHCAPDEALASLARSDSSGRRKNKRKMKREQAPDPVSAPDEALQLAVSGLLAGSETPAGFVQTMKRSITEWMDAHARQHSRPIQRQVSASATSSLGASSEGKRRRLQIGCGGGGGGGTHDAHTQLQLRLRDVQAQERAQAQEARRVKAQRKLLAQEAIKLRAQVAAAHNSAQPALLLLADHLLIQTAAQLSVRDLGRLGCVCQRLGTLPSGLQSIVQRAAELALADSSKTVRDRAAQLRSGPESLSCLRMLSIAQSSPFSWRTADLKSARVQLLGAGTDTVESTHQLRGFRGLSGTAFGALPFSAMGAAVGSATVGYSIRLALQWDPECPILDGRTPEFDIGVGLCSPNGREPFHGNSNSVAFALAAGMCMYYYEGDLLHNESRKFSGTYGFPDFDLSYTTSDGVHTEYFEFQLNQDNIALCHLRTSERSTLEIPPRLRGSAQLRLMVSLAAPSKVTLSPVPDPDPLDPIP